MPNITFLNSPPFRDWMSDGEKEFRLKALEYITAIINANTSLVSGEVQVRFFETGVASVVALLEQEREKIVIKTCFKPERAAQEAFSFIEWNKVGVKTPKVLSQGKVGEYSYFIMEYIDSPTIKEVIEKDSTKKSQYYSEMGRTFHKIHSIPIQGFGPLKISDGLISGTFLTLREAIIVEINPELEEALSILEKIPTQHTAICHFDFSPNHLFATEPLTIFDPDPEANLAVIDLAFFCLLPRSTEDREVTEMRKIVIKSYMEDSGPIDSEILAAAVVLKVHEKAHSLRLLPSPEREKRAQNMLDKAGSIKKALVYIQSYLH